MANSQKLNSFSYKYHINIARDYNRLFDRGRYWRILSVLTDRYFRKNGGSMKDVQFRVESAMDVGISMGLDRTLHHIMRIGILILFRLFIRFKLTGKTQIV